MDLIKPGDERYDDARTVFNSMIDKRPAVIAQCATPADVRDALDLASRERYEVAVRAGGHSVAGVCLNDGGLVIDVRAMKDIHVDPDARQVRVGAGVTWGEFDRATQEHGLATTGGRVSTTGVAGLTLGGGSGWAERAWGLSCDNLVSVDLVTADGREVTASENENPDLFWALHGGGGNFGVATSFVFALHDLGPLVTAGLMLWPGDDAAEVARQFRNFAADAPDELGTALVFLTGPPEEFVPAHLQGTTLLGIAGMWVGDADEGSEAIRPLKDLAPEVDLVGPMPYADFQCMIDDPPGMRNYWSADYHDSFGDDALDVFVKYGFSRQSPLSQQLLLPWGGAVARVAEDATPMTKRATPWITHPFAVWEHADDDDANIEWARSFRRDIAQHATGGVYLNFIGNEGDDRVRAAFGEEKYARLASIKGEWDPTNVFRGNQNIQPA
jgi:FAD/FMN-containing dehydrogenase